MNTKPLPVLLTLAPLVFSFIFAMDIYIPDVPKLVSIFHTSQSMVQLTLSVFMFMTGIGQLIIGPLSDQYGRLKVASISIMLFVFASALCALSSSINMLIIARILQAFGGCGMLVVAFATIRDLYAGDESARMYSYLNCCTGVSPLIAPIIGSYLNVYIGWRSTFWFLVILGLFALTLFLAKFKETLSPNQRVAMDKKLFKRYLQISLNRHFQSYAIIVLSAMSMFFIFFSFSPYIIMQVLKKPPLDFGYYFFAVGSTFFVGSYLSAFTIKKLGTYKTARLGVFITLIAGIIMLSSYLIQGVTILNFIGPCMILGIGGALMLGAGAGGAMEPFYDFAGTAAAVLGFIEFAGSAMIGYFVLSLHNHSTLPLAITILVLSTISILLIFKLKANRL